MRLEKKWDDYSEKEQNEIASNLYKWVIYKAKKNIERHGNVAKHLLDDFIGAGLLLVSELLPKYDPGRGFHFESFAGDRLEHRFAAEWRKEVKGKKREDNYLVHGKNIKISKDNEEDNPLEYDAEYESNKDESLVALSKGLDLNFSCYSHDPIPEHEEDMDTEKSLPVLRYVDMVMKSNKSDMWAIFMLHNIHGVSFGDIALMTGVDKNRVYRAYQKAEKIYLETFKAIEESINDVSKQEKYLKAMLNMALAQSLAEKNKEDRLAIWKNSEIQNLSDYISVLSEVKNSVCIQESFGKYATYAIDEIMGFILLAISQALGFIYITDYDKKKKNLYQSGIISLQENFLQKIKSDLNLN